MDVSILQLLQLRQNLAFANLIELFWTRSRHEVGHNILTLTFSKYIYILVIVFW